MKDISMKVAIDQIYLGRKTDSEISFATTRQPTQHVRSEGWHFSSKLISTTQQIDVFKHASSELS